MAAGMAAMGTLAFADAALARDQIRIVGSSTVYPFTTAVAEQFGKSGAGKTPVVESTGTGGGMKLFCAGVGETHPDLTNASRAIKKSEFDDCQKNGVTEVVELKVGIDGLTLAQSKGGPALKLTMEQVFLALAQQVPDSDGKLVDNPYKNWSDIDKSLPAVKIVVLGPPTTSGTRDSLHELFLEAGAKRVAALKDMQKSDAKGFEKLWKTVRKDGAYVDAGENDNVIVQKLEADKNTVGVFGYSFLEENAAKLRGVPIDGIEPTYDSIASGKYEGSRPLFVYVKKQHMAVVPGMDKFIAEYVSAKAMSKDGYLARKGLVALPKAEAETVATNAKGLKLLTAADVK
jgi:phosphate transport system substrate-binding protein